ncbi:MAG TPA: DHH family phosphoesterase [Longimicrobiales bacterium]|nr:DHH family phosphoesterase [Longimicrobiales bacterium]
MTAAEPATQPVLLIISDRPHVWGRFQSPVREVRRWVGERDSDEKSVNDPNLFSGDPCDTDTYTWAKGSVELSAVVDLQEDARAQGAITALRVTCPTAAVLVITDDDNVSAEQIEISRYLQWTDALRGNLEIELKQLEALRRLTELRRFAEGEGDVPILVHPDPDPDAVASALAVRALIRRDPVSMPIVTLGEMTRPENRRMVELLQTRVTEVTTEECMKLDRMIAVDFQPRFKEDGPRLAVIDHHPRENIKTEFEDIRPHYGATATMMYEYLRLEDERRIATPLATALLYGIKTDTDSLARECIGADVEAYAFLQNHADLPLLRRMARPSYSVETAISYGDALTNIVAKDDFATVFLGEIDDCDAHVMPDIADFCLSLDEITWVVASAIINDKLVLTIRHIGGGDFGAGDLAKKVSSNGGSGGGHSTMARAVLPLEDGWKAFRNMPTKEASSALLDRLAEFVRR